ncbi:hypothetical protein [Streptomyces sp. NPDC001315]|uniref:hypothetical protein n=1 Tax=Streptomyces sp. NPDC001315 TaxID=3364562 RepID=UPI0036C5911C
MKAPQRTARPADVVPVARDHSRSTRLLEASASVPFMNSGDTETVPHFFAAAAITLVRSS